MNTAHLSDDNLAAEVEFRHQGGVLQIILNRPRALNALTTAMCRSIRAELEKLDPASCRAVIFLSNSERGFCGGGDVKAMVQNTEAALEFLREEYAMDAAIAACSIPTVAIMDGITMGGGIGIGAHCSVRVVTERSTLAMPETRIGIVPDVGINRILAAAPQEFGQLVSTTSCSFSAGDAIAAGLADYYVNSAVLPALIAEILAGAEPITVAEGFAEKPPKAEVVAAAGEIAALTTAAGYGAEEDAGAAIRNYLAVLEGAERFSEFAAQLRRVSPLSAAVALERVRALHAEYAAMRSQSVQGALLADYKTVGYMVGQPDFNEGVRARLIDKDDNPVWSPANFEAVTDEQVREAVKGLA